MTSAFGAFLDPVADKLMVATVLILLATQPLKGGPWAGNTWLLPSLSSGICVSSPPPPTCLACWRAAKPARHAYVVMTSMCYTIMSSDQPTAKPAEQVWTAAPPSLTS